MSLTDVDHRTMARARKLADVAPRTAAVREHTGETDIAAAFAVGFGEAHFLLGELLAIIDRLEADHG